MVSTSCTHCNSANVIQLNCLEIYHDLLDNLKSYTNWIDKGTDCNVPPTDKKSAAASVALARRYFQSQNQFWPTFQLVQTEANLNQGYQKLTPYKEFFATDWALHSEPMMYNYIFLEIIYAMELIEHRKMNDATSILENAKGDLRRLPSGDLNHEYPRLRLLIAITTLKLQPDQTVVDEILKDDGAYRLAVQNGEMAIAQKFSAMAATKCRDKATFLRIRRLKGPEYAERLKASTAAHFQDFMRSRWRRAVLAAALCGEAMFENSFQYLKVFEAFLQDYPEFDIPAQLCPLLSHAIVASSNLQDQRRVERYSAMFRHCVKHSPEFNPSSAEGDIRISQEHAGDFYAQMQQLKYLERFKADRSDVNEFAETMVVVQLMEHVRSQYADHKLTRELAIKLSKADNSEAPDFDHWLFGLRPETLTGRFFGQSEPIKPAEWDSWFLTLQGWLQLGEPPSSLNDRLELLKTICEKRIFNLSRHSVKILKLAFRQPQSDETERLRVDHYQRLLYEQSMLYEMLVANSTRVIEDWTRPIQNCQAEIFESLGNLAVDNCDQPSGLVSQKELEHAQAVLRDLVEQTRERQHSMMSQMDIIASNRPIRALTFIAYRNWQLFGGNSLEVAHWSVKQAEKLFQRALRQGAHTRDFGSFLSAREFSDLYTLNTKHGILISWHRWEKWMKEHPDRVTQSPLRADINISNDQGVVTWEVMTWVQRAKARALLAITGQPWEAIDFFNTARPLVSPQTRTVLDAVEQEFNELESLPDAAVCELRKQALRERMMENRELKILVDILLGNTMDAHGITGMMLSLPDKAVFVDWFIVNQFVPESSMVFWMGVYSKTFNLYYKLKVRVQAIEAWVTKNIDVPEKSGRLPFLEGRDATRKLSEISDLLEPLKMLTEPGDLLIFCPTRALHKVPLHAIPIDREPAICRNPIAYTQSASIFRLCLFNRMFRKETSTNTVFSPMLAATDTIRDLEEMLDAESVAPSLSSHEVKKKFINLAKESDILHFHGHVLWRQTNPLDHHLILGPSTTDPNDDGNPIAIDEDAKLTVKEIFALKFPRGAHITAVSCQSGRVEIDETDDLLGLSTAFHYAGVSSMVTTLWRIRGSIGAQFSKLFYASLIRQAKEYESEEEPLFVNAALAIQDAVVELRTSADAGVLPPYFWAGFILNGNPFLLNPWRRGQEREEGGSKPGAGEDFAGDSQNQSVNR